MHAARSWDLSAAGLEASRGFSRTMRWLLWLGAAVLVLGMLLRQFLAPAAATSWSAFFAMIVDPARVWPNVLLASYYLVGLGVGATAFLALNHLTRAGWSVAFRRVPEAMTRVLPVAALMMLVGLVFGLHDLYEWSHEDAIAGDAVLRGKTAWLNGGFFLGRAVFYLVLWIVLSGAMVRYSLRQDANGDPACTRANVRLAAAFLVLFALTLSAASFDWIMSLDAHWFSTIFAVYNFAGILVSSVAAITVGVVLLRRRGPLRGVVNTEHLHGLGKLLFAFSTFWAYIWFCQYMLIWYTNMPEETFYFTHRHGGSWGALAMTSLTLNWVVPFLVLLPRPAKRSETVLLVISGVILIGHWLDLFVMILPPFSGATPSIGVWELGAVAVIIAVISLTFSRAFHRAPPVPLHDPFLEESLHHHQ